MPTTTQKEHTHEARSLDPRTGRRLTKRLAAVLNPAQPFLVALRQRDLRRLFAGLVVSQAGDWLYNLALLAFVYERTGSTVWVGITTAARILPEVVLGPIGGVLADRHDRRLVMIASDVLRAAAMAALAVVALAGGPVVLAPVLAALCTAAGAAYPQCVVAVLPRLVDEADLPAANAARVGITGLCVVAGPLIGAVLLLLGSAAIVFAVNGVSFLFGALVVAALPRDAMRRPAVSESHASLPADLGHRLARATRAPGRPPARGRRRRLERGLWRPHRPLRPARREAWPRRRRLRLPAFGARRRRRVVGRPGGPRGVVGPPASRADPRRRRRRAATAPARADRLDGRGARARREHRRRGSDDRGRRRHHAPALTRPGRFARAYGLVLPACVAGIAAGALLAPPLVAVLGLDATLLLTGTLVLAYGALAFVRPAISPPVVVEPGVAA